jgi:hypothetical protein
MSVKAVEMVRKIRDRHYKETKDLSAKDQKALIKEKSERLQARYKDAKEKTAPK